MTYRTRLDDCTREIEDARAAVADAQFRYGRDGKTEPLNAANRRLADAHDHWREHYGLRVPDRR